MHKLCEMSHVEALGISHGALENQVAGMKAGVMELIERLEAS